MDVESKQTLDVVVDNAHQAGDEIVDRATTALAADLKTALAGVASSINLAVADAAKLIAGLDGWTLRITVPPITIRLTKPEAGR